MSLYFNEIEPFAAEWIQNLYPESLVDCRSICDVQPEDLEGFDQAHLFAGLAGWAFALQLANWPQGIKTWTGSAPCQPFSAAGKRKGVSDARHLWPEMRRLIEAGKPAVCFGEQVASKDGRDWFAGVRADLEALGYEVGGADLCAPCAGQEAEGRIVYGDSFSWEPIVCGGPHIRQRIFWFACSRDWLANSTGVRQERLGRSGAAQDQGASECRTVGRLAQPECDAGQSRRSSVRSGSGDAPKITGSSNEPGRCGNPGRMADSRQQSPRNDFSGIDAGPNQQSQERRREENSDIAGRCVPVGIPARRSGPPGEPGLEVQRGDGRVSREESRAVPRQAIERAGTSGSPWSDFQVIPCLDGKSRRAQRGIQPLAHGIPRSLGRGEPELARLAKRARANRTGRLKAYGNSIAPEVAAGFVGAFMEVVGLA